MSQRVLSQRVLNRALLARQLLLERASLSIPAAVGQVGGLQTQYAPSGYVGLWTRLRDFQRDDLTRALEDRSVVQATLMRTTIHMVPGDEFWRYAMGVRQARREWALRMPAATAHRQGEAAMLAQARAMRQALADGPRSVKELGPLGAGFVGNLGLWVDLVRVPPSGTWQRRRADLLALADDWLGPCDATEEEGLTHLVRAYLRAFGPAPWKDVASWAGISVADAKRGGANLALTDLRDADGRPMIDLAGTDLPDPDTPAPVRFLPHWDASLLVHARRTGILPEPFRPRVFHTKNPFSVGVVLVDGAAAAAWSLRDGHVVLDPFRPLGPAEAEAIEAEREPLEVFHAGGRGARSEPACIRAEHAKRARRRASERRPAPTTPTCWVAPERASRDTAGVAADVDIGSIGVSGGAGRAEGPLSMERVTGIGGIFFRSYDPQRIQRWYVEHLGLPEPVDGDPSVVFTWRERENDRPGSTVWAPFPAETDYFGPRGKAWMLNLRVRDLDAMLTQLREAGVEVEDRIEDLPEGRFGWFVDPDGNRVELWQPPEGR